MDFVDRMNFPRVIQNALCESRFAGINVSRNSNVPERANILQNKKNSKLQLSALLKEAGPR